MKTKHNLNNCKTLFSFSFLFIFIFLFSISSVSSGDWLNYGSDETYVAQTQIGFNYGNLDNGYNITNSTYGQTFQIDNSSQPIIVIEQSNDEKIIVIQEGLYLRILDENLNLLGEKELLNNPVGHHAVDDIDDDGINEIIRFTRLSATELQLNTYEINNTYGITKDKYFNYTLTSINNMLTNGVRCTLDLNDNCYATIYTNTVAGKRNIYQMEIYGSLTDLNASVYTVDTGLPIAYNSSVNGLGSARNIDGDSRAEYLIYTPDHFYIRDSQNLEADVTLSSSYSHDFIESASFIRNVDGYRIVIYREIYDDGDSNVGSYLYLYNATGGQTDQVYIGDRYQLQGLAIADYNDDGYEDIYTVKSENTGNAPLTGEYGTLTIYNGNDLSTLYSGNQTIHMSRYYDLKDKGHLQLGKLNEDDYFDVVFSSTTKLLVYDFHNDTKIYESSLYEDMDCAVADITGSLLNDVVCIDDVSSMNIRPLIDTLENVPSLIKNIPDQYLNTNSDKDLNLNNYFSNYDTINLTALNDTISVDLNSGGTSKSLSNENISLGLLDFGSTIIFTIRAKNNEYNLTGVQIKAINTAGDITDNFNIYISEEYITGAGEEADTFLSIIDYLVGIFPDSEDLTITYKMGIIILVMLGVAFVMILGTASATGGLSSGALYLTAFLEFLLFIFFIAIGYISIGILIVLFLLLLGIAYFKLFKGDS